MTSAYQGCLHVSVKHRLGPECAQWKGKHFFFLNKKQQFLLVLVDIFPTFHSLLGEGSKFIVLIQKMDL